MSPINVEIEIGERSIKLPDIPAGTQISLSDMGAEKHSILVVGCNENDEGGLVRRQQPQDTRETLNRRFRIVSRHKGEIEAVIGNGEAVNLEVTTKFGRATLSLTHYSAGSSSI